MTVDELKALLAPYMYHRPECPANNDHACTCGCAEVRLKVWGSKDRPVQEPDYTPHRDSPHNKKHRQRFKTNLPDWPIGMLVDVWLDGGKVVRTTTRSKPAHLGGRGGHPVVWCEGITGCYSVNHVYPVENRP